MLLESSKILSGDRWHEEGNGGHSEMALTGEERERSRRGVNEDKTTLSMLESFKETIIL